MTNNIEGPRSPVVDEWPQVMDFLNLNLRSQAGWSIAAEYPTTLHFSNLHNMRIIKEHERVLSHAVLRPIIVKSPHLIYKVGAIGSVVTDESHRGKGLSTQIIGDCINLAGQQQCDIAILWTNLYDFYRKMGFELAGSEVSIILEDNFSAPTNEYFRFSSEKNVSSESIFRLYSQHSVSTVRSPEEIKKYLTIPNTQIHTAWSTDGQLSAYAIEGKGADLTGYIHEWGGSVSALLALFSHIRKEKNSSITIICPRHANNLISQLKSINGAIPNFGYLGMIKIINFEQLSAKIKRAFRSEGIADFVLEKQDKNYIFGVGKELFTLENESLVTQLLFGPVDYKEIGIFSEQALSKIQKILPLQFWLWGWDSI